MQTAFSNLLVRLRLATRPRRRSQTSARLHLPANSTLRTVGPVTVLCTHGTLWVTQANDPEDHILPACQPWHTSRPGRVVIQALAPATLTLRTPATTARRLHFLLPSTNPRAAA